MLHEIQIFGAVRWLYEYVTTADPYRIHYTLPNSLTVLGNGVGHVLVPLASFVARTQLAAY